MVLLFLKLFHLILSITGACNVLFNIFLQSQIASHTAAGALLFAELLLIGCPCEVQPETMISSAISIFTDLTHIQVKCPFNYGILDGLLMLLNQMINQVTSQLQQALRSKDGKGLSDTLF